MTGASHLFVFTTAAALLGQSAGGSRLQRGLSGAQRERKFVDAAGLSRIIDDENRESLSLAVCLIWQLLVSTPK